MHGFPFVGAGDAAYSERAEVFIVFAKPPLDVVRRAIEDAAPPPLAGTFSWAKEILHASSAPLVHCAITATYSKGKKPRRTKAHVASATSLGAFNAAIETWLEECHTLSPVLVAFRPRDTDAPPPKHSPWHAWSAENASGFLPVFAKDFAAKRTTPRKKMATAILIDILERAPGFALTKAQKAAVDPIRDAARRQRRWEVSNALAQNAPRKYAEMRATVDGLLLDTNDRLYGISVVGDRIDSWSERLEGDAEALVVDLATRVFPLDASRLSDEGSLAPRTLALALYTAFQAAIQAKKSALARQVEEVIRAKSATIHVGFVYVDLVRAQDGKRLRALADEVMSPTSAQIYDAACRTRDPSAALALYERVAGMDGAPWQAVNNGIAALLTVYPNAIPKKLANAWLARGRAVDEAACKHNVGCLLARLGKFPDAVHSVVDAIAEGAAPESICADRDLVGVLDHEDIVRALDARFQADSAQRRFLEALRLTTLGVHEQALDALVGAIDAGMAPADIRDEGAFKPLHSHAGWRRIRQRGKKR